MRLILAAFLAAFLPGAAVAFGVAAGELYGSRLFWPVVLGAVIGIVVDWFVLDRIPGLHTFEHELTHALVALVFLRPIARFVATRRSGGYVQHGGGFGGWIADDFIGFAPYVVPTFTVAAVLARPLVPAGWFPYYDVGIGATFGFHLRSTIDETARNWSAQPFQAAHGEWTLTDIGQRGFAYSVCFIATLTLAIHGLLLELLVRGGSGAGTWAGRVWRTTQEIGRWMNETVIHWVARGAGG
jgi:hypothetical protein